MPRLGIVASETQTPSARERLPPTLPLACLARVFSLQLPWSFLLRVLALPLQRLARRLLYLECFPRSFRLTSKRKETGPMSISYLRTDHLRIQRPPRLGLVETSPRFIGHATLHRSSAILCPYSCPSPTSPFTE